MRGECVMLVGNSWLVMDGVLFCSCDSDDAGTVYSTSMMGLTGGSSILHGFCISVG